MQPTRPKALGTIAFSSFVGEQTAMTAAGSRPPNLFYHNTKVGTGFQTSTRALRVIRKASLSVGEDQVIITDINSLDAGTTDTLARLRLPIVRVVNNKSTTETEL